MMEKIVFDSGLTAVLDRKPEVLSAAVSVFVAAGNRFETIGKSGISHFIEHMVFKGTKTLSSEDIARESDIMGGQLNAYTAKEYTCFYSRALSEHVGRTLKLICDMICNPSFAENDIKTEKGVVLEEIGMYEDSPEDLCSDMLTALCYKNDPLGFNILGTREDVSAFTAADLRDYMKTAYSPERIVVSLCGNFDRAEVVGILESFFRPSREHSPVPPQNIQKISGGITLCPKDSEQTQIAFCFNGLPLGHQLRYATSFYSSLLGGASSSRLNRRIREELGLAYSAYSFTSNYSGTGVFGISAGLAPENVERFFKETSAIIKASRRDITKDEIEMTREQFKAGIVLSNESMSSVAASAGRQLLLEGKYSSLEKALTHIDAVTLDDVLEVAELITSPETVALSAVGRVGDEKIYEKLLDTLR